MNLHHTEIKRILLFDDDEGDTEIFKEIFAEINVSIELTCATNCAAILKQLDDARPDLVFLDIQFPLSTGFECLEQMKQSAAHCRIPVVMYTTSSLDKDIKVSFEKGAALYCQKLFSLELLKETIQKILQMRWDKPEEVTKGHLINGILLPYKLPSF